jgi:hypothetical protein
VSVCGTVPIQLKLRGFSWKHGINHFAPQGHSSSRLDIDPPDLPKRSVYTLKPGHPTPGWPNLLRLPIALNRGIGILTDFPSATLFSLTLGADSPCADERCAGNLGLSASGPFTRFIATHVSIRTSDTSSRVLTPPSQAYRTLSYHVYAPLNPSNSIVITALSTLRALKASDELRWSIYIRSFGAWFEPRYIFRAGRLDQ